jgi:hypothetical protein
MLRAIHTICLGSWKALLSNTTEAVAHGLFHSHPCTSMHNRAHSLNACTSCSGFRSWKGPIPSPGPSGGLPGGPLGPVPAVWWVSHGQVNYPVNLQSNEPEPAVFTTQCAFNLLIPCVTE